MPENKKDNNFGVCGICNTSNALKEDKFLNTMICYSCDREIKTNDTKKNSEELGY